MALNKKSIKDWLVNIILSLVVLFGMAGIGDAAYQQNHNAQLSAQVIALTKHSLAVSNDHHAETVVLDNKIKALTAETASLTKQVLTETDLVDAAVASHSAEISETAALSQQVLALQKQFVSTVQQAGTDLGEGQEVLEKQIASVETAVTSLANQIEAQQTAS